MKLSMILLSILSLLQAGCKENKDKFNPGKIWNDIHGNPINAHGGGILYVDSTYYWFGEYKKGETKRLAYIKDWECYRTDAGGISCYSSKDLLNWKFERVVLPSVKDDSAHDLHISKVIERPKVVYNEKTGKYVMWMHVDSEDYSFARAGVAISDNPAGPYTYLGSVRPNGNMSRDMTVFKDTDGKAYNIYTSESNATMHIALLSDDYLKHTKQYIRVFENKHREAPAVIKSNQKYYLITSACTGWSPNEALYAVSDSMMGNWELVNNPCVGRNKEKTFYSQSTFILPVEGKENSFVYLGDRWNKTNLEDSRYVWLPMTIKNEKMEIGWKEQWSFNGK